MLWGHLAAPGACGCWGAIMTAAPVGVGANPPASQHPTALGTHLCPSPLPITSVLPALCHTRGHAVLVLPTLCPWPRVCAHTVPQCPPRSHTHGLTMLCPCPCPQHSPCPCGVHAVSLPCHAPMPHPRCSPCPCRVRAAFRAPCNVHAVFPMLHAPHRDHTHAVPHTPCCLHPRAVSHPVPVSLPHSAPILTASPTPYPCRTPCRLHPHAISHP